MASIEQPRVGTVAPDFELPDTSGNQWSLQSQRGGPVVLIFHRHIN